MQNTVLKDEQLYGSHDGLRRGLPQSGRQKNKIKGELYPMINVTGLTKVYRDVAACNNVSLTARSGEITVLLGPNGAGKSTTIKSIAGLLKFRGNIEVCGFPNKSSEAKRCFGYIPEAPALYELLTPWEHMEFIARAYRLDEGWKDYAEALFRRLEIDQKKNHLTKELSKGMTQKVSIAAAMLIRPKALVVDEPLVGLDPKAIDEVLLMFRELKESGSSVLVSTHIIDTIDGVWDRAYIMNKGCIIHEATRESMGGRSLKELFFSLTEGGEKIQS